MGKDWPYIKANLPVLGIDMLGWWHRRASGIKTSIAPVVPRQPTKNNLAIVWIEWHFLV